MQTSENGIQLIKQFESFAAAPYLCPAGKPTIGYGHVIREGENFSALTKMQADAVLRRDVAACEASISRLVQVPLSQGQFDALVSFVFNLGAGALKRSTLLRRLNEGNYTAAADNFQRWVYAKNVKLAGLVRRRAAEWALFTGKEAA
jgi:lysozyme